MIQLEDERSLDCPRVLGIELGTAGRGFRRTIPYYGLNNY